MHTYKHKHINIYIYIYIYTYILDSYDCKYMTVINLYNLARKFYVPMQDSKHRVY